MKRILCILICFVLLCGCTPLGKDDTSHTLFSGYETKVLEFQNTDSWDFAFQDGTVKLHTGDGHSGFKLDRLLYRPDENGLHSVRADFSCSILVDTRITYKSGGAYGNLIKFYPADTSLFPKIVNDSQVNTWYVVLEDNIPLKDLGLSLEAPFDTQMKVTVTSFSIHYSQHNTVNYVTIAPEI